MTGFRESLSVAYADYRDARRRGWRGDGDASKALAEMADLLALLDVCLDETEWRRGQYMRDSRVWPLTASRGW